MLLGVFLDAEPVGELAVVGEKVEFRLLETYRGRYPRRVLARESGCLPRADQSFFSIFSWSFWTMFG